MPIDKRNRNSNLESMSAAGKVYTLLRHDIINFELKPGTLLKEKDIAERFSVSRTPIREACLQLASENLLEIRPQSGTVVSHIKLSVLWDAYFVRRALESAAIRKLAKNVTSEQQATFKTLIDEQEFCMMKGMSERFAKLDEDLHNSIIDFAGHPNLCEVLDVQKAHIDRIRYLSIPSDEHISNVFKEHVAIVDALIEKSPEKAELALDKHLSTLPGIVSALVKEMPEYFVIMLVSI